MSCLMPWCLAPLDVLWYDAHVLCVWAFTGKTTLLDILAGRKPYGVQGGLLTQWGRQAGSSSTASGEVRINGRLVDSRTLSHVVG
eukprot:scaffold95610_cov19-Tisochrysis_lutea.AAC.1